MANENRYYKTPFAESGDKTEVPNESTGGAVGYDTGFGPDYELPQGTVNRKRIERDMWNGLQNGVTGNLKQWQEKLYPTWIEDNGDGVAFSYSEGMIVSHNNANWISNEDSNQEEPGTGDKWSIYSVFTESKGNLIYRRETTVSELSSGIFDPEPGETIYLSIIDRDDAPFNLSQGGDTPNGFELLDAGNGNTAVAQLTSTVNASWVGCKADNGVTDSTAALSRVLQKGHSVFIPRKGSNFYTINELTVPESLSIVSDRAIIKWGNNDCMILQSLANVINVEFFGEGKQNPSFANQVAIRGTGSLLSNIIGNNFRLVSGIGVLLQNSVGSGEGNLVSGNIFNACNDGLVCGIRGEYVRAPDNVMRECQRGMVITGGNINCGGTVITSGFIGVEINSGDNDSHGVLHGVTSNHNTVNLFATTTQSKTFSLVACQFFVGNIALSFAEGVKFNSCTFSTGTISEESTKNCYFKNCDFKANVVFSPNFNSSESEAFYLDCTYDPSELNDYSSNSRLNGGFSRAEKTVTGTPYGQGSSDVVLTRVRNEIEHNPNYSVRKFFENGEIKGKDVAVRGGGTLSISSRLSVGLDNTTAWNSDLVQIDIVDVSSGELVGTFTPLKFNSTGASNTIDYIFNGTVKRSNLKLVMVNSGTFNVAIYGHSGGSGSYIEITGW